LTYGFQAALFLIQFGNYLLWHLSGLFRSGQTFTIHAVALFLLLFLAPFLRGEAILYFGLMLPLLIYYYHVTQNFKSVLLLAGGLIILAVAISLTLHIRSNYLIHTQFKRVYLDISIEIMHYTYKYSLSFIDYLFMNEFGFAIGNFGIIWGILIFIGIGLLYYRAYQGETLALITVLTYTLFYIPFMMQKITFYDPHAILFYWNRYYLSVLLVIHLLSLALLLDIGFKYLQKLFSASIKKYISMLYITILLGLLIFSIPMGLFKIVLTEPHQPGSYHLVPWLKTHIGKHPVSVIYDSSGNQTNSTPHLHQNMTSQNVTIFYVCPNHPASSTRLYLNPLIHWFCL